MKILGTGTHGVSIIPDSISVGGEPSCPWQDKEEDAWLAPSAIEKRSAG